MGAAALRDQVGDGVGILETLSSPEMNVLSPNERTISLMWRLRIAPHRIHVNSEIVRSMNVLSQRYARDSTFILSVHRICAIDSTFMNRIGIGTSERAISRSKQSCDKCPLIAWGAPRRGATITRRSTEPEPTYTTGMLLGSQCVVPLRNYPRTLKLHTT